MSHCKGCQAPIRWVVTRVGKLMPINVAPDPAGKVALASDGRAVVLGAEGTVSGLRYTSHFATCVHAAAHRKRKRP